MYLKKKIATPDESYQNLVKVNDVKMKNNL